MVGQEGEARVNSGLIGKIEKAHRYAQEPHRIRIQGLSATFGGDNSSYALSLDGDSWTCDCHTAETFGDCQHVMALQLLLKPMLSEDAQGVGAHQTAPLVDGQSADVH